MRWNFHGLTVEGLWDDAAIGERWQATFASRPLVEASPDLVFRLALTSEVPPAPSIPPAYQQGELLAYYVNGPYVIAHFPRFGQLQLDLARGPSTEPALSMSKGSGRGSTVGAITPNALAAYGVFEDLLAIGLSPHFRRRGLFLLHAFAAAAPLSAKFADGGGQGRGLGVLLVGDIGAGKTTTGLALLHAGWKLLSNDSPILTLTPHSNSPTVLSYPGLLSAYPDTLARFPELASLAAPQAERQKTLFAAESIYPDVWADSARPAAIFFPQVVDRHPHADALEKLRPAEALPLLLPHAVEQWDRKMIPAHLALLKQLVEAAPAYRLRLGPDVNSIPALLLDAVDQRT